MTPTWLTIALDELGQAEVPGPSTNPRIAEYLRSTSLGDAGGDETPWCAAFVGWCLEAAGQPSTRSATALSYQGYGTWIGYGAQPIPLGAIAVLTRDGGGHVGFYLDRHAGQVYLLGGNQGDRVSVSAFPTTRVLSYRWPR